MVLSIINYQQTVMMIVQFFVAWFLFAETKGVPLEQLGIKSKE